MVDRTWAAGVPRKAPARVILQDSENVVSLGTPVDWSETSRSLYEEVPSFNPLELSSGLGAASDTNRKVMEPTLYRISVSGRLPGV